MGNCNCTHGSPREPRESTHSSPFLPSATTKALQVFLNARWDQAGWRAQLLAEDGEFGPSCAKALQTFLNFYWSKAGWRPDELRVDGDFGPSGIMALQTFLKNSRPGLSPEIGVDGRWSVRWLDALQQFLNLHQEGPKFRLATQRVLDSASPGSSKISRLLYRGSSNKPCQGSTQQLQRLARNQELMRLPPALPCNGEDLSAMPDGGELLRRGSSGKSPSLKRMASDISNSSVRAGSDSPTMKAALQLRRELSDELHGVEQVSEPVDWVMWNCSNCTFANPGGQQCSMCLARRSCVGDVIYVQVRGGKDKVKGDRLDSHQLCKAMEQRGLRVKWRYFTDSTATELEREFADADAVVVRINPDTDTLEDSKHACAVSLSSAVR